MSRKNSLVNSINRIIGDINYKITRKLGEGMFSTVKLATHSLTGSKVAIKILEKTRISKIEDKERINREMAIIKRLHHFNIAKLYQIVENKLTIYLIQEHVEGKEFMEYLTKKGKLMENEACKFYHQIISGLDYIHHCGIAHRDFKPENILLTNDNTILKIIDFGLSNTYKNNQLLKTACGSPCYASPEMIQEQSYNGALSDIWSSGIILYLMLCGNLPFYHEQNEVMYKKILSGKFDLPKHLSDNAKDILKKILEVNPKKRLNFEEIKAHPWFNIIDNNYLIHKGINVNEDIIPIDDEIIKKMEKIGFNKMEVKYMVLKNFHNRVTTVYDLFLKQKIDNGKKSIADLHSDLFDEYINDKKNKISFYGSFENALKNRIFDQNKNISILPHYFEDKYDDNDDSMIVGDNGSVIERLIKSGRFTYDEENMCLNRVSSASKPIKKESKKEIDGDSKFKTLTQMNNESTKKIHKKKVLSGIPEEIIDEREKEKGKEKGKEKEKKSILKNSKIAKKTKHKKGNIIEDFDPNEDIDGEDNDWYKEIEAMITGEKKKPKSKDKNERNEGIKKIYKIEQKAKKSSSAVKRKKKNEENEENNYGIDTEESNFHKLMISKSQMRNTPKKKKKTESKIKSHLNSSKSKNDKVLIKPKTIYSNNEKKLKHKNYNESAKNLKNKNPRRKMDDLDDYFDNDNKHDYSQSLRTSNFSSMVKKAKNNKKLTNNKKSEKSIGRNLSSSKRKK